MRLAQQRAWQNSEINPHPIRTKSTINSCMKRAYLLLGTIGEGNSNRLGALLGSLLFLNLTLVVLLKELHTLVVVRKLLFKLLFMLLKIERVKGVGTILATHLE